MARGGDDELLRAVAAGDAATPARLYERYAGPLFGYLHRLDGDRMTAEEILQDTMLAVWRSAAAFEGRARLPRYGRRPDPAGRGPGLVGSHGRDAAARGHGRVGATGSSRPPRPAPRPARFSR